MAKRFSKFLRKAALAYKQRAEAQHKKPRIDEIHRYLVHEGVSPELGKKLHETISKQTEVGAGEKVISVIKAAIEQKRQGKLSAEGLEKIVNEAIVESEKGVPKDELADLIREILRSELQKHEIVSSYVPPKQAQISLLPEVEKPEQGRKGKEIAIPLPSVHEGGLVRRKPGVGAEWRTIDLTQVNITFPLYFAEGKIHFYANIRFDPKLGGLLYRIIEPQLTKEEKALLDKVEETLVEELEVDFAALKKQTAEKYLKDKTNEVIEYYGYKLSERTKTLIDYYIARDFIGLERVEPVFQDAQIEDISCDGVGVPIYVYHRDPRFGSIKTNIIFHTNEELDSFVMKLAQRCGRSISVADPLLDGALPDGSRVQATFGSGISMKGSNFTIRKFTKEPLTLIDLIKYGTVNSEMLAYFWLAIEHGKSILIAGPTASGKTTYLNALSLFIRPETKVVTIEDTPELRLPLENWVAQVARLGFGAETVTGRKIGEITLFDLLKASLRQRPDVIIVGEVRGQEAYVLFQQIATGHPGLSTIHAESLEAVINRLRTPPIELPPSLVQHLDILVVLTRQRVRGEYVRRTKELVEITGYDIVRDHPYSNVAYTWDPVKDVYGYTGKSAILRSVMETIGSTPEGISAEIERRMDVIEWMYNNGIRDYKNVGRVIAEYYQNAEGLMQKIAKI